MCLLIVTHAMVCDARPAIYHPDKPNTYVVNPFSLLEDKSCRATASESGEGDVCPAHRCCRCTARLYPCDCGRSVRFNLYVPSKTPCAYTAKTDGKPQPGVWRLMEYFGGISSPAYGQRAAGSPSEKLRIARSGLQHAAMRLCLTAENIAAASCEGVRDLVDMILCADAAILPKEVPGARPGSLGESAAPEQQFIAKQEALDGLRETARFFFADYQTWKSMVEKFEREEHREAPVVGELAKAEGEGE